MTDDGGATQPRVVFVENNPMFRRAFVRGATLHGIDAVACSTEAEARDALHTGRADLIVLDFHLSDDTTSERLARELQGEGALVLVFTGDPKAARAALGDLVPIVPKTGDPEAVFAEIKRVFVARARELAATLAREDDGGER